MSTSSEQECLSPLWWDDQWHGIIFNNSDKWITKRNDFTLLDYFSVLWFSGRFYIFFMNSFVYTEIQLALRLTMAAHNSHWPAFLPHSQDQCNKQNHWSEMWTFMPRPCSCFQTFCFSGSYFCPDHNINPVPMTCSRDALVILLYFTILLGINCTL